VRVSRDVASAAAAKAAVMARLAGRPIDHVLSGVGFVTVDGVPTQTSLATLQKALDDGLLNAFLVAKAFLPEVKGRHGASYTLVSGGLAHMVPPMPVLWLGTLKNAAVNALSLGLASETAGDKVRVNTLCIHVGVAPVGGTKNQLGMPAEKDTLALGPAFLGIARGTSKGQVICLQGWDDVAKLA
jgi:NAD(P)-dependent dehydrogenase (short-subunit alcohol dehydrogenase family)